MAARYCATRRFCTCPTAFSSVVKAHCKFQHPSELEFVFAFVLSKRPRRSSEHITMVPLCTQTLAGFCACASWEMVHKHAFKISAQGNKPTSHAAKSQVKARAKASNFSLLHSCSFVLNLEHIFKGSCKTTRRPQQRQLRIQTIACSVGSALQELLLTCPPSGQTQAGQSCTNTSKPSGVHLGLSKTDSSEIMQSLCRDKADLSISWHLSNSSMATACVSNPKCRKKKKKAFHGQNLVFNFLMNNATAAG